MQHYYFKFQTGNKGITIWCGGKNKPFPNDKLIPLSIYFGRWKCSEKDEHLKNNNKGKKQIERFWAIRNNFTDTYFWIFYEDRVLCFKPVNGRIYDGPKEFVNENESLPKSLDAKLIHELKKHELPEVFANINSNQKYNRVTITELDGAEKAIAEALIRENKIKVSRENFSEFLSPIEFETLVFLIFNKDGCFCSSFRGGTLKDFDLKISLSRDIDGLSKGDYWVQVKKQKSNLKPAQDKVLVHLGRTDTHHQILGVDWLKRTIDTRPDILDWLEKMTYKYNTLFEFKW